MKKMTKTILIFTFMIIMVMPIEVKSGNHDLRLWFTSGFFSFSKKEFREMYGVLPVVDFGVEIFPGRSYGFNFGVEYISGSGKALAISGEPDQIFQLNFSRLSLPLSVRFRLIRGKFEAYAGAGGVFSYLQEKWPDAGLSHKESKFHLVYESGFAYSLIKNLVIKLGLVYESIFSNYNSPALYGAQPNLGGFSLKVGVGYRFKLK